MSSLLGVGVGGVGVYPRGYRWGRPAKLLHVPLASIYHAVAANHSMELQQGWISVWGRSRECVNSRVDGLSW